MVGGSESLQGLEGSLIDITFLDGSRIEGCEVISARRPTATIWVSMAGIDAFIPRSAVLEVLPAELSAR